jgi:hypothetical protein
MAGLAMLALGLLAQPAQADFTINLNQVATGDTPSGSAPWLTATFVDTAPGVVTLTLTSNLTANNFLQGSANNMAWLFNFNPDLDASDLTITYVSGVAAVSPITQENNGATLSPFDAFDIGFYWSSQNRFEEGDTAVYTFSMAGLTAADFQFANGDGYYSAAHIQGTSGTAGSSKIYGDEYIIEPEVGAVPAPAGLILAVIGVASLGSVGLRRRLRGEPVAA